MKAACIILSGIIVVAIMAVCVMVKFATDINVEEKNRVYLNGGGVYNLAKSMGIIALDTNSSMLIADRFPYVAAVTRNSSSKWSFACFASVILVKWIVTSAHCRKQGAMHRVLLYHDFARNYTHTYPILIWRLHEKYNSSQPTPKYDIAVAKLNVDSYPITMKSSLLNESPVKEVEASVWKTVSTMDKKMFLTNDFDKFEVSLVPNGRCFETYGVELDDSLLCVDMAEHEDCFIYEFGPIFDGDRVAGLLAVKPRDCDVKLAIFTNVSYYTNWILRSTHAGY
ncbi:venom peptide isomerase heavy chain-like [Achroia grisella]|uniref:venom peptide isomerase heavy chain-like n=1 Tax=Achroia grisella TaxID=688607 RepID=UPI0027D2B3D4|nr:venom peptide isomerase heavy chain-like [Achroia grisella]